MFAGRRAGRSVSALASAAIALAVFVLFAALHAGGHLQRLEYGAADFRAGLLQHEVDSDIVVVGMDPASLREVGEWPWPRSLHARLIDRLRQAGPRQIFIDIDFSSPTHPEEDARLEEALAAWRAEHGDSPIVLPVFVQSQSGADVRRVLTQPLERFARHAALGSVDQRSGSDGLVRRTLNAVVARERTFPSAVARLAGIRGAAQDAKDSTGVVATPIDFSIDPSSLGFVSYSDLLAGRIAEADLAGKTVMVGAWAVELGDMLPVPVHRALPGVAVQALAVQTARAGGVKELAPWVYVALLAVWIALCTALFCRWSWKRNLLTLAGALGALAGAGVYAYAVHRLALESVPFALSALTVFVAVNLKSLEEHIKARQAQRRKLEFQARHDALTELPNRVALAEHLQRALAGIVPGESAALLMLDLCRFKEVNDTLGHNVGDQVLCEVARRFRACIAAVQGGAGFIARIGGDEFTVVFERVREIRAVEELAHGLQDCLRGPIEAAGIALDIGLSIGIALFPQDAQDAQTLLKRADVAMYLSKRHSLPFQHYDTAQDEHSVRRLTMVTELRAALSNGTLELWYQPQVNLRSRAVESLEALLRWRHPMLGAVSPAEFIPVAEATDLIRPLTEWTLARALGQIAQLRREGAQLRVAVNLSARMLQDSCFPARLHELLCASGIEPGLLELEITESAMMLDPARALRIIREIHALGVLISIDDYGTGFSSLSYLRDLPIHALKLDKSFVIGMKERPDNRVIVESTAEMASALNLTSIAEGAETDWHAGFLASAGYDFAQGYCYSPALPPDRVLDWLEAFHGSADIGHRRGRADAR
jgi:diguanylate cyclase (GGDEF)-like protein